MAKILRGPMKVIFYGFEAMDINLRRKSDLPFKKPCFRISKKGRGF